MKNEIYRESGQIATLITSMIIRWLIHKVYHHNCLETAINLFINNLAQIYYGLIFRWRAHWSRAWEELARAATAIAESV